MVLDILVMHSELDVLEQLTSHSSVLFSNMQANVGTICQWYVVFFIPIIACVECLSSYVYIKVSRIRFIKKT